MQQVSEGSQHLHTSDQTPLPASACSPQAHISLSIPLLCSFTLKAAADASSFSGQQVAGQKNVTGYLTPSDFLRTLREKNELFRGNMQQDAHEFFNFLINDISDTLVEVAKKVANEGDEKGSPTGANGAGAGVGALGENGCEPAAPIKTWMHTMFEGVLTNETRCLCCETISNRDETFVDLSLDIEQNSSVSACLRNFSKTETLTGKNKFYCETCCTLQEADKQMKLKKLPNVLTLHLKRFKYVEDIQSFSKLSHRVVFPHELKLPNMTKECVKEADERLYALFAVVVHIGRGPNHGHYVAIVKSRGRWLLFDDELVELVDESVLSQCFGVSNSGAGQNISTGERRFPPSLSLTVSHISYQSPPTTTRLFIALSS
ncbi:unnamed protein product [Chrysoparadoxa australica]